MAKRMINTSFWTDPYIGKLSSQEKITYLYLLTNPCVNVLGIYEIETRRIAFDIGGDISKIEETLNKFEKDEKIIRKDDFIFIKNFWKHQNDSPNIKKGMQRVFEELPDVIKTLIRDYIGTRRDLKGLGELILNLTNTKPIPNSTKPIPNLDSTQTKPNAPADSVSDEQVFNVMRKFKKLSPQLTGGEENQQEACLNLWREYGEETLAIVDQAILVQGQKYAPKILSPLDLWKKIGDLHVFLKRSQENINPNKVARVGVTESV